MWNAFYRHPRLLILSVALIFVGGLTAFQVLPRSEDPELIGRNALVVTRYPGAADMKLRFDVIVIPPGFGWPHHLRNAFGSGGQT